MKIPADTRIRQYELTYILPASYTSDEAAKIHTKIASAIDKLKGSLVSQEDWGKRELAYKIKHAGKSYTEGVYTHLVVELDRQHVASLERELMLNQQLLRYLLVIAEPTPVMATKSVLPEIRGERD